MSSHRNYANPDVTHAWIAGLGDELALAVDAGVRTLSGDPLLAFGHVSRRRRTAPCVLRTYDFTEIISIKTNGNLL